MTVAIPLPVVHFSCLFAVGLKKVLWGGSARCTMIDALKEMSGYDFEAVLTAQSGLNVATLVSNLFRWNIGGTSGSCPCMRSFFNCAWGSWCVPEAFCGCCGCTVRGWSECNWYGLDFSCLIKKDCWSGKGMSLLSQWSFLGTHHSIWYILDTEFIGVKRVSA